MSLVAFPLIGHALGMSDQAYGLWVGLVRPGRRRGRGFADGIFTTPGMFDTLGVSPVLGRAFTDADDRPGGGQDGPVPVISHAFWQRRFGGAVDTIGRRLTLERTPFTIVGIMPPDFFGPDVGHRVDIVVPIGMVTALQQDRNLDERDWWWLSIMLRLRNGQSADQATAALRVLQPQMRSATLPLDWPAIDRERYLKDGLTLVPAATGNSALRTRYQRPLLTIQIGSPCRCCWWSRRRCSCGRSKSSRGSISVSIPPVCSS